MKKQEIKPVTESDLPEMSIRKLYSLALNYNPLSRREVTHDFKYLEKHPKDTSAKTEFISNYLTHRS